MTRDFEKYFPLPLEVVRVAKHSDLFVVRAANGEIFSVNLAIEDNKKEEALTRHLVQCANLMPEAVDILKSFVLLCKKISEEYSVIDTVENEQGEEIEFPLLDLYKQRCEDFLVKLEGGGNDAQNS